MHVHINAKLTRCNTFFMRFISFCLALSQNKEALSKQQDCRTSSCKNFVNHGWSLHNCFATYFYNAGSSLRVFFVSIAIVNIVSIAAMFVVI